MSKQCQVSEIKNNQQKNNCPTIGYIRDHGIKYLLRRQPANTLCHGPADPWRWAESSKPKRTKMKYLIIPLLLLTSNLSFSAELTIRNKIQGSVVFSDVYTKLDNKTVGFRCTSESGSFVEISVPSNLPFAVVVRKVNETEAQSNGFAKEIVGEYIIVSSSSEPEFFKIFDGKGLIKLSETERKTIEKLYR